MKKRLLILLLFPLFLLLQSCSDLSNLKFPEIYDCGDFCYSLMKVDGEMMAGIRGASDESMYKEIFVIPEYLDGYKVYGMYDIGPSNWHPRFVNAKKIFINHIIKFEVSSVHVDKIFMFGQALDKDYIGSIPGSNEYYPVNLDFSNYTIKLNRPSLYHANLSYYTNYGDNTIYWIDDYDNELVSYIPDDPTREGYIFDGWYKESECINKWDFENDIIPAKEYNKGYPTKEYIYKENQLFAKWIIE